MIYGLIKIICYKILMKNMFLFFNFDQKSLSKIRIHTDYFSLFVYIKE